jgi:hypothetical protein
MTTQDPRYKHKPSEKHTLEEVLKSLQDLIRNDLPGEKSAGHNPEPPQAGAGGSGQKIPESASQKPLRERIAPVREDFAPVNPAAGPVNLDAVMRSLKDLIGNELNVGDQTPSEEPTFEEPDELMAGEELVAPGEDLAPPLPEEDILESAAEALAPPHEEPGFEDAVDFDLGADLELPEETPATSPAEPVMADESAIEFVSPDEELTLEEMAEAAPPGPEEIPEEIPPELVTEPVIATAPPAPKPAGEEKISAGTQQELLFEEPAPLIIERQPPIRKIEPEMELKPETAAENTAPETSGDSAAQNLEAPDEAALPTIDVEETVDDGAYFDVETPQAESPPAEEIIAPAVETPAAPEATTSAADSALAEPGSTAEAAPAPELTSSKTELKLEIAEEPATKTPSGPHSVDFDSIGLTPRAEAPGPSSVPAETTQAAGEPPDTGHGVESMPSIDFETVSLEPDKNKESPASPSETPPAPASEPPAATEATIAAESTPEVTMEKKPAPDEIKKEAIAEPEKNPDEKAAAPASTGENKKQPAPTPESGSARKPPAFNLDDIPVLHEVVAPPAGSMLAPPPGPPQAPLPAPDRARDIVVRAVAKLNVEMRKSGGAGLDTKTILRLQKLMRQELEKDGKK